MLWVVGGNVSDVMMLDRFLNLEELQPVLEILQTTRGALPMNNELGLLAFAAQPINLYIDIDQ